MRLPLVAAAAALGAVTALAAPAQATEAPPLDREQVEQIVRDLLKKEPGLVLKAANDWKAQQEAAQQAALEETVRENKAALVDAGDPSFGDGPVTLVEFLDYQCGYCRKALPDVMAFMDPARQVRVVFKEYPVLGAASELAAKAALAAREQGGDDAYLRFHKALYDVNGRLSDARIFEIAGKVGLDVDRLRKDMEAPEIAARLDANRELAAKLQISGTPAFVIGDRILRGAVGLPKMERAAALARQGR